MRNLRSGNANPNGDFFQNQLRRKIWTQDNCRPNYSQRQGLTSLVRARLSTVRDDLIPWVLRPLRRKLSTPIFRLEIPAACICPPAFLHYKGEATFWPGRAMPI